MFVTVFRLSTFFNWFAFLIAVDVLFELLFHAFALVHSILLVQELVLLHHSLQVLKNHLPCEEAANESLHLDDGDKGPLIDLDAVFVIDVFALVVDILA